MTSLTRDLRKDLENTVKQARRVAEAGARKAVEQLGVGEGDAPKHLTPDQRALRNRLRAHGRQLGDRRDAKVGTQATSRLVQECAYEHWHRMLFARFLAETDLLIEPVSGVAITLDEVQELARERSTDWLELASDYAERMLPQIFRKGDPVLDIALPPETRSELEDLLKKQPRDVFQADDSLGWVYQFWQADKKDEINKSETKIGADELPAVTQLFTEDYMVLFLLHNTLGAWWAGKILAARPDLARSSTSEGELRAACKVGDVEWTYLRFVRGVDDNGAEGPWRPAAGPFEGWPKSAKEVTMLDPCMGSGHFLIFALPILVAFRMAQENMSREVAVDAVLRNNLFGLEIDPRCTQIAAFNLAFTAWRIVGYRPLPRLNLACSGLDIGVTKVEWLKLAERAAELADPAANRDIFGLEKNLITSGISERARNGLERLYDLFAKAPWLGSLIDPHRVRADLLTADFAQLESLLTPILTATTTGSEFAEMAVAAQGMAKAAELLGRQFTIIVTNVPYLVKGKQTDQLREHSENYCNDGASDLATVFIQRCINFTTVNGTHATVSPQNWLYLRSYKAFRKRLLREQSIDGVARVGSGATSTASWDVLRALAIITNAQPRNQIVSGLDIVAPSDADRARCLRSNMVLVTSQEALRSGSDAIIAFRAGETGALLGDYASSLQGISTGDSPRMVRAFWEVPSLGSRWRWFQVQPPETAPFVGRENIVDWDSLQNGFESAAIRGEQAWSRRGVAVAQMRTLPTTLYGGTLFSNSAPVIVPNDERHLAPLWAFCRSPEFNDEVRRVNAKMSVDNGYLRYVPFDLHRWEQEAATNLSASIPEPTSLDPTQWLFAGAPARCKHVLQVVVAQLLGYYWPRQRGETPEGTHSTALNSSGTYLDHDGIVCLFALKGEAPAEQRLNALLADVFRVDWSAARLVNLLTEVGFAGKTLDDWLRDGFFQQHCELFQLRPFVWHIWDGRRDGFHALVNYHRLSAPGGEGRRLLEKLIYSYLGDWIDRQRVDQKAGVEGVDGRLAAAERLRAELTKILEGEPPYDVFVRWKPLHEQPIGWEPDINDGVRMNIRPFMTARPLGARGANVSILRTTPKIKWDKDRGKEPTREKADYPWFWGWDGELQDFVGAKDFDGNRWSDLHYSRAVKQAARDRHRAKVGGKK
jgi:hypothetical protein